MSTNTAVLSDIHGNPLALDAVLEDVRRAGCRRLFLLGDTFNGVAPHACVARLQEWCAAEQVELVGVKGNAESYLLTPDLDQLPERTDPEQASIIGSMRWFADHLTPADRAWLDAFPLWWQAGGIFLAHDSPLDRLYPQRWQRPGVAPKYQEWFYHARGIRPDTPEAEWERLYQFMQSEDLRLVFCGHTHMAFSQESNGRLVINAGSVGMPLDGDPRAAWVLLEQTPAGSPSATIRRVDYDIPAMQRWFDDVLDYPAFLRPGVRAAFKKWVATGIYWKAHMP
jgi:predicted phosphodiesterase